MTKQTDSDMLSERDRSVQIEITPEMIQAGRHVFALWFALPDHSDSLLMMPENGSVGRLVTDIFCEMTSRRPISSE